MKKTLLASLLSLATLGVYAQSCEHPVTVHNKKEACRIDPNMPARAKAVWPQSAYIPLEDPSCPPCYEYRSKYGYMVMECPFLMFPPEHSTNANGAPLVTEGTTLNGESAIEVQSQNTYSGHYPAVCKRAPNMPAGAVPAWPKSQYTALQDPSCPPCYEYRSKYGYMVMECPFLRFPPEHDHQ